MNRRQERLRDFQQRVASDPNSVRHHAGTGPYVLINPLADEAALLASLEVEASSCAKVDLYWEYGREIVFVQIMTEEYSGGPASYSVRRGSGGHVNVVAVVPDHAIDSAVVDRVLTRIACFRFERRLPNTLQTLPIK